MKKEVESPDGYKVLCYDPMLKLGPLGFIPLEENYHVTEGRLGVNMQFEFVPQFLFPTQAYIICFLWSDFFICSYYCSYYNCSYY